MSLIRGGVAGEDGGAESARSFSLLLSSFFLALSFFSGLRPSRSVDTGRYELDGMFLK